MSNVINIRPPEPPTPSGKRPRKPVERFSHVEEMLADHQKRVYEACAVLGALASHLHSGTAKCDEDQRVKTVYTLDAALRLLTPVACIDSFSDLVQQDEDRREAKRTNLSW